MIINFKYGFKHDNFLYGWHKRELYRLPSVSKNRNYTLKRLSPIIVGNNLGYCLKKRKFSLLQLERITILIDMEVQKIKDKDLPLIKNLKISMIQKEDLIADKENPTIADLHKIPHESWVEIHDLTGLKFLPYWRFKWLFEKLFICHTIHITNIIETNLKTTVSVRFTYKTESIHAQEQDGVGTIVFTPNQIDTHQNASAIAKTYAVKNAAMEIGAIFGKYLNIKEGGKSIDEDNFVATNKKVQKTKQEIEHDRIEQVINNCKNIQELDSIKPNIKESNIKSFNAKIEEFSVIQQMPNP